MSGDGFEVASIDRVSVAPGEDIAIVPVGPTLSFRELQDQLVLKDESGSVFLRKDLGEKKAWGGIGLVWLTCALFLLGAALKSAQAVAFLSALPERVPAALWVAAGAAAYAGVLLVVRLDALFGLGFMGSGAAAVLLLALPFAGVLLARWAGQRMRAPRKVQDAPAAEGGAS